MEQEYLAKFYENIKNLSKNTQVNHKNQLNKYLEIFGEYPFGHEVNIVENVETIDNQSKRLTFLKTISKIRKVNELPNEKILLLMKNTNDVLTQKYINKNIKIKEDKLLPSYEYMIDELDKSYKEGEWKKYIINYLLLNLNVRNKDVDIKIVRNKSDATDENQNYIVIKKNSSLYIRNKYKTSKTYGQKMNLLKSKKIVKAINEFIGTEDSIDLLGEDLKTTSNIGNVVRRYIIGKLKETDVLRLVLAHKNSLDGSYGISKNRGTSVNTLQNNYNTERDN